MIEPNAIVLGDAYELIKEIPDNSIDLIVIDPPYEFPGKVGGGVFGVKNRPYHLEIQDDEDMICGITDELLMEFERVMKLTNIYIFCSKYQLLQFFNFYKDKNFDILIWKKTNPIPMMSNSYLPDIEYIFFARERGSFFKTTYENASKVYTSETNKKDKILYGHPSPKPEELVERFILNSSDEGDVVLDCFLGSGTTAAMAKKNNRRYIGIEKNEKYVSVAKDRLNGITLKDRRMEESGQIDLFDLIKENGGE